MLTSRLKYILNYDIFSITLSFFFFFQQAHQQQITVLETEYSSKEMKLQEQVRMITKPTFGAVSVQMFCKMEFICFCW